MPQGEEESAGGMSYRTMREIDTSPLLKYLEGQGERASQEILEKNKEYYIASAHKIMARLELAQIRVKYADLDEEDLKILDDRISHGLKWLEILKNSIKKAKDNAEFLRAVPYKKWHAVKLIPSAAEGYAINASLKRDIKRASVKSFAAKKLENTKVPNERAGKIFLHLLNLKEHSDFKSAEKARIKAYNETNMALKILKDALGP